MKLTVKKQSLIDWTVENESGVVYAWIQKEKLGYNVRISKNVAPIGWDVSQIDFEPSFIAAKARAFSTIALILS